MNTKKFIDFIITQKCSYSCEYCSQSKMQQNYFKQATKETINNFLNFIDNLSKDYEITISGGEAMLHPDFLSLIKKIKDKNFKINLITNLSFAYEKYETVFNILKSSLNKFDVSVHLSQIKNFDIFLDKLNKLILIKPENTVITIYIPIFNINLKKEEQINLIKNFANANNISLYFQHIRILNEFIKYNENEKKYFNNEKIIKSYGNMCHAGYLSAVIYENGDAYRCYSSRLLKSNFLGNINDKSFKLNKNAKPCVSKICTCSKPFLYNQLSERKNYFLALITTLSNLIYMPKLIFQNRTKLKQKIIQKFILKN